MKLMTASLGVFLACVALSACEGQRPEVDQIAQSSLIGLSKKKILACLGPTTQRTPVGLEEIWTYRIGHRHVAGIQLAILRDTTGHDSNASPLAESAACDVHIVIDGYGVSRVYYSRADGGDLPLGEECHYEIHPCVAP